MSQRTKTVEIDGTKYTVYELTVKQIRQVIEEIDQLTGARALEILAMCTDVTLEDIEGMAPSNIRDLWGAWSEANKDFLHLIQAAMKRPPVQQMIDNLLSEILTAAFADLSRTGTAPPAGLTGGVFSETLWNAPTSGNETGSETASRG